MNNHLKLRLLLYFRDFYIYGSPEQTNQSLALDSPLFVMLVRVRSIQTSPSSDKVRIDFWMFCFITSVSLSISSVQYQTQKRQESRFVGFLNGTLESVPSWKTITVVDDSSCTLGRTHIFHTETRPVQPTVQKKHTHTHIYNSCRKNNLMTFSAVGCGKSQYLIKTI